MLQYSLHHELSDRSRTREFPDSLVYLGKETCTQVTHLPRVCLCRDPLKIGHPRLPQNTSDTADENRDEQSGEDETDLVSMNELSSYITQRSASRDYRAPVEPCLN